MTAASQGLDFDDFLGHSATQSGGAFLENWKEDGSILIWLHPEAPIHALWSHRWLQFVKDEDGDGGDFRMLRVNCLENENVLKRQRFRHGDGTREYPPTTCPHCLLVEFIRAQIEAGELSWTDPVFKFEGDEDDIVIRAGGITGLFQKRDMSEAEKRELKRAGVYVKDAFKENGQASLEYVFGVIANENPDAGCVVACERQTLGKKMQKAIRDRMEEHEEEGIEITNWRGQKFSGKDAAKPSNNPCCFKWAYDANKDFSDKYDVKVFANKKPSPDILAKFAEPPPDVARLVAVPDLAQLRESYERYSLIDLPLDELFGPAERALGVDSTKASKEQAADETADDVDDDLPESWGGTAKGDPPKAEAENMVECDHCKKPMPESAMTCPHCGAEYIEDDEGDIILDPDWAPKKKARRRKS